MYRVFSFERCPVPLAIGWRSGQHACPASAARLSAGDYDNLRDAIAHAESVTFGMVVVNGADQIVWNNQRGDYDAEISELWRGVLDGRRSWVPITEVFALQLLNGVPPLRQRGWACLMGECFAYSYRDGRDYYLATAQTGGRWFLTLATVAEWDRGLFPTIGNPDAND